MVRLRQIVFAANLPSAVGLGNLIVDREDHSTNPI
jgi:hypothetical protein